ncbi:NMT1/THI5 like protein [uncultured archaeon]|nr:NMT1/THI5 like protein [uncultured archaeon]
MSGKSIIYFGISIAFLAVLSLAYLSYHPSEHGPTAAAILAQNQTGATATVKVSYAQSTLALPMWVAEDQGYFKEENITVEGTSQLTLSLVTSSMLAGKADVGVPISFIDALAVENKQPGQFKAFMVEAETLETNSTGILVRPNSTYSTIADLKGKRVGHYPGLNSLTGGSWLLGKYFNISEVTLVTVAPAAAVEALVSNQVDALMVPQPTLIIAVNEGLARDLPNSTNAYTLDPYPQAVCAFSSKFVEQNPQVAARFVKAMDEARAYIEANPQGAMLILANHTNMTVDQLRSGDPRTPWLSLALGNETFSGAFGNVSAVDAMQALADKYYESGYVNGTVNMSNVTYVKK